MSGPSFISTPSWGARPRDVARRVAIESFFRANERGNAFCQAAPSRDLSSPNRAFCGRERPFDGVQPARQSTIGSSFRGRPASCHSEEAAIRSADGDLTIVSRNINVNDSSLPALRLGGSAGPGGDGWKKSSSGRAVSPARQPARRARTRRRYVESCFALGRCLGRERSEPGTRP